MPGWGGLVAYHCNTAVGSTSEGPRKHGWMPSLKLAGAGVTTHGDRSGQTKVGISIFPGRAEPSCRHAIRKASSQALADAAAPARAADRQLVCNCHLRQVVGLAVAAATHGAKRILRGEVLDRHHASIAVHELAYARMPASEHVKHRIVGGIGRRG